MHDNDPAFDPPGSAYNIGFIGLGSMGRAMASNLASDGCRVTAYHRRPEQAAELRGLGLRPTQRLDDVFDCDFVFSMVSDDAAAQEIVLGKEPSFNPSGLASGLKKGAIHISMSTISPTVSTLIAHEHRKCGQGYVAAPVFGNPDAAKARQLFVIAAGLVDEVERCRPIFAMLGQKTFVVGVDPSGANLVKLAGNVMSATALEILGEVLAFLRKCGLDPAHFIEIITGTMFDSRLHKIYGARIAAEDYPASGFLLPLALKDVRLALAEADSAGVPMPSVSVVHDRLLTGIARGYGARDWTTLGLLASEDAGLTSPSSGARGKTP
jgi:3-hydroxyisobutyrate dehydrogenase-like beta-hydroxyacid dehydrogenase